MDILAIMMKIAGGVRAAGMSGTKRVMKDEDLRAEGSVVLAACVLSSLVALDGLGNMRMQSRAAAKHTDAKIAACWYVLNRIDPRSGPAIKAKPAAMPNFPTLPARSVAVADSS